MTRQNTKDRSGLVMCKCDWGRLQTLRFLQRCGAKQRVVPIEDRHLLVARGALASRLPDLAVPRSARLRTERVGRAFTRGPLGPLQSTGATGRRAIAHARADASEFLRKLEPGPHLRWIESPPYVRKSSMPFFPLPSGRQGAEELAPEVHVGIEVRRDRSAADTELHVRRQVWIPPKCA